jgi:hypothetical protein
LDSISYADGFGNSYNIKLFVLNQGSTKTIKDATIKLICNDPWVSLIDPERTNLPDILPGTVVNTNKINVRFNGSTFPGYFNFKVEILSDGWPYWTDSMQVIITGIENDVDELPTEFALAQNYPNPFNPSTKISWQSPVGSWQTIKMYDILGNEIATLIDEYRPAGKYETEFTAANLPSGVYFYQLRAGDYVDRKKMLFLK